MSGDDERMGAAFRELRRVEAARAPGFEATLARASATAGQRRPSGIGFRLGFAVAVAGLLLLIWNAPHRPDPEQPGFPVPLAGGLDGWYTASDVLLETPGSELLRAPSIWGGTPARRGTPQPGRPTSQSIRRTNA